MLKRTYNEWHFGDNIIHLNFIIRALELNPNLRWIHYCRSEYVDELKKLVANIDAVEIRPLDHFSGFVTNSWIGSNNFIWLSQLRYNWVEFHLEWFAYLSSILEIENPILQASDLYFRLSYSQSSTHEDSFDFLINNTMPLSGQVPNFNPNFFNSIANQLISLGFKVIATNPGSQAINTRELGLTALDIGWLSTKSKYIIGVPNGPIWTTFNTKNQESVRIRIFHLFGQVIPFVNTYCYQREEEVLAQLNKLILSVRS